MVDFNRGPSALYEIAVKESMLYLFSPFSFLHDPILIEVIS